MFKKNILKYICIFSLLIVFFLSGCEGANPIVSINIEGQTEEEHITFVVGEFSYDNLNLVVTYKSGETKLVPITEAMINKDDLIKLYKLGKNQIEVIYEGKKTTFDVYGTYKQFADLYLNDVTTTYTGNEIKVEVEGNVPDTARIIYPQGNIYKNAGTYVTRAIIFENGYEVLELSANVVINKAQYDMSSVEFNNAEYTYDGKEKMLMVQGNLPAGVSVSYFVNGALTTGIVDSGEYEVTAVFSGDSKNYEEIEDKKATMTIKKATYNMEGIRLEDIEFTYDGKAHELKLTNELLLPSGVEAVYKNNRQTDAGIYDVVVEFELEDESNYVAIEPLKATMIIEKAEYDLSEYYLLGQKVKYEVGKNYEVSLNQPVPDFVDVVYEYYPLEVKGKWNILNIDATEGYWYTSGQYVNVGKGTIIQIEVPDQTVVSIQVQNDVSNFDIKVENGIATILCLNADGLASITLTNSENEEIKTVIDVTLSDVIFHNENEPLCSEILPSLKGEYIIVAKLVVEDKNYYGEKELTAFLIIE